MLGLTLLSLWLQMLVCSLLFTLGGCHRSKQPKHHQTLTKGVTAAPRLTAVPSKGLTMKSLLSSNRRILQCSSMPQCTDCSSPTVCTACVQNYLINSGSCYYCNPLCAQCLPSGCNQCQGNLQVSSFDCICTGSTYYFDSTTCYPCMPGCLSCWGADNCGQAQIAHYIHTSGTGVVSVRPCISNCNTCYDDFTCANCQTNYKLENQVCVPCGEFQFYSGMNTCTDCTAPCRRCTSALDCSTCIEGFMHRNDLKRCGGICPARNFWNFAATTPGC